MPEVKTISALVVGGEASAGPPLGPALGPLGVNVMAIVKEINEQTDTKQFTVEVGIPTTSTLIVKESGIPKGSGTPNSAVAGNLSIESLRRIAELKIQQSYASTIKAVAKEISGSCLSMGVTIEGKNAKQFLQEIAQGQWDAQLVES